MTKQRTYSKYAQEAAILLGEQIKLRRKQRRWTEQNLAERAGIARLTLQKIERGEMTCALGLVFEVAALVGIHLFDQDATSLTRKIQHTRDMLVLLPKRIKQDKKVVDDDF